MIVVQKKDASAVTPRTKSRENALSKRG